MNIQANHWWGQMRCGPPNQNCGRAMAHPAHAAAPPMLKCTWEWQKLFDSIRNFE